MKWLIETSTVAAALGAGPQNGNEEMTQRFTLSGPGDQLATGVASSDVVAKDVMDWARAAHSFESIGLEPITKRLAAPKVAPIVPHRAISAKSKAKAPAASTEQDTSPAS